jgi:hypothetical protein
MRGQLAHCELFIFFPGVKKKEGGLVMPERRRGKMAPISIQQSELNGDVLIWALLWAVVCVCLYLLGTPRTRG